MPDRDELLAQGYCFREADLSCPADQTIVVELSLELQNEGRARYRYEGMPPDHFATTQEKLIRLLVEVRGRVFLVIDPDGIPIGIAICQTLISTWKLGLVLNLQDFYVRESLRSKGIGTALLVMLEETARDGGYVRFNLETQVVNHGARRLYKRRGYEGTEPDSPDAVLQMRLNFE